MRLGVLWLTRPEDHFKTKLISEKKGKLHLSSPYFSQFHVTFIRGNANNMRAASFSDSSKRLDPFEWAKDFL